MIEGIGVRGGRKAAAWSACLVRRRGVLSVDRFCMRREEGGWCVRGRVRDWI